MVGWHHELNGLEFERTHLLSSHPPMRTLKSQLTTEQLSIKKKVEPTKDILQPKTKKESQDGRRGDS